jgi:hypothetical protein
MEIIVKGKSGEGRGVVSLLIKLTLESKGFKEIPIFTDCKSLVDTIKSYSGLGWEDLDRNIKARVPLTKDTIRIVTQLVDENEVLQAVETEEVIPGYGSDITQQPADQ